MVFAEKQPIDLIDSDWIDEYEKEITSIWWQLVRLNTNLFILERIAQFPFELFQPWNTPFWKVTFDNFFEASMMIVWRISIDTHGDVLTIRRFRNNVLRHFRDERLRSEFNKGIKTTDFDGTATRIQDSIQEIRHNYSAHFNRDFNVDRKEIVGKNISVSLQDIRTITDNLNSLIWPS